MAKKPLIFPLVAFFLVAVALGFPLQVAFLYEHDLSEWAAVFGKLTLLNYVSMTLLIATAVACLRVEKHLNGMIALCVLGVTLNNFVVGHMATDFNLVQTTMATLALLVLLSPLTSSHCQWLVSCKTHQWWKTPARFRKTLPVQMFPLIGETLAAESVNLSSSGMLIKLKNEASESATYPKPGTQVDLKISLGQLKRLHLEAEVVREVPAANDQNQCPSLGLRFTKLNRRERKQIQNLMEGPELQAA